MRFLTQPCQAPRCGPQQLGTALQVLLCMLAVGARRASETLLCQTRCLRSTTQVLAVISNHGSTHNMAASALCLQVSVDVPWSPYGIDGRSYDWQGVAAAADLLFVMAYDMQSQASLGRRGCGGVHAFGRKRVQANGSVTLQSSRVAGLVAPQIWGSCVASANSPAALVRRGVQQWLELGIPAHKLVLGLPW